MTENTDTTNEMPLAEVYFDDRCPLCCAAVGRWTPVFGPRGIRFHGMSGVRVRQLLRIDADGFPREMRLRRRDGSFLGGIDAIAWMCRQVPWLWIAGVLISAPGIHWMSNRIYRWVARNRFCLGDLCEVAPRNGNRRHTVTIPFLEMP